MKEFKIFSVCAACFLTAACASQNKDDRIVLGTPSVISEMPPVQTAPVNVEDLDITAPPAPAIAATAPAPAAAAPAAQAEIVVGDTSGPRPTVSPIHIAPTTDSSSGPSIDVQVEGTNQLQDAQDQETVSRPVVPPIRIAPQSGTTQTVTTAKQTQSYKNFTLGQKGTSFKYASAELTPAAKRELTAFVAGLKNKKYKMIYIGGNTDSSGDEQDNLTLSQNRAQAVADFLAANNIPREKITYKGYGSQYPIATNSTAAGRAKNRRVDILVK
ncbi:MAG: OmpA family protein [Elusimicrobia bacterium]|nr:OmpA family protein [Elusimicrobiota bacterium]